ncbi:CBS domain-containing protein [Pseudobacteriovorax antillogorgiicola]|uniref:Acetoin utilization protein AcuB n=1 Tax=Pseudobacteriovorax antillogorgiicola TaxID=1513793 RepID=A0A1Y6CNF4_9BACT|nr:CBS domain-containing protein [Pseudobacteriovorax antillogorgiicola]TCS43654.1 acetoin utilization protein AcuB [Pseudobacteriovorax antillogorgiicola]SMF79867.1 acetoin utilization protein AcuB [Pseudobacteriovorax antillogorgiicola]
MTQISEYMTKVPHSIEPNCTVQDAKERMYELGVTHLPVMSGGKVIGILSERDILYLKGMNAIDISQVKVGHTMTEEPVTVLEDQDLKSVCSLMVEKKIGSTLVQGKDGKLSGIFTYTDALKALAAS